MVPALNSFLDLLISYINLTLATDEVLCQYCLLFVASWPLPLPLLQQCDMPVTELTQRQISWLLDEEHEEQWNGWWCTKWLPNNLKTSYAAAHRNLSLSAVKRCLLTISRPVYLQSSFEGLCKELLHTTVGEQVLLHSRKEIQYQFPHRFILIGRLLSNLIQISTKKSNILLIGFWTFHHSRSRIMWQAEKQCYIHERT